MIGWDWCLNCRYAMSFQCIPENPVLSSVLLHKKKVMDKYGQQEQIYHTPQTHIHALTACNAIIHAPPWKEPDDVHARTTHHRHVVLQLRWPKQCHCPKILASNKKTKRGGGASLYSIWLPTHPLHRKEPNIGWSAWSRTWSQNGEITPIARQVSLFVPLSLSLEVTRERELAGDKQATRSIIWNIVASGKTMRMRVFQKYTS